MTTRAGSFVIQDGAITTVKIAGGAVSADKLAGTLDLTGKSVTLPAGVALANLADGSISTAKLADAAVTTAKIADGAVNAAKLAGTLDLSGKTLTLSAAQKASDYLEYREEQVAGTNGGTFTSGAWQTRTLNTEVSDAGGHGSLSTNQITLAAGTYECEIFAPARAVGFHKARLRNITDGSTTLVGGSFEQGTGSGQTTMATVFGRFTIAAPKVFEVQHRCQTTGTTTGFGSAATFDEVEVYTTIRLRKVA